MNKPESNFERVIGLDAHPDSFTAAILRGPSPVAAVVEQTFNKVPLGQLGNWARKHTTERDLFLLEASGNSFQLVRQLQAGGRRALVLESCHLGRLKEAHANNDKLSAVRIARAYLAGTPLTGSGGEETLRRSRVWSPRQWQVVAGKLLALRHSDEQRRHWRSLIAQEVATDPEMLALTRLCGIRDLIAFALVAVIGDIGRFARPGSLVKYLGLNPAFDDSGQGEWRGGIGGHGRQDLRSLLMEAAQAVMRSADPVATWGKRLLARKGSRNLAVAALARKLAVAVWYALMGKVTPLVEVEHRLALKVGKIITQIGAAGLKQLGKTRKALREEMNQTLKTGRSYVLKPRDNPPGQTPHGTGRTLAQEYGLV